jgi:hypothetical protein
MVVGELNTHEHPRRLPDALSRHWLLLACLVLGACSKSESPAVESRPRPIGPAPSTRGSVAAEQAFATRVCTVIRNTVSKAGAQGTRPMVVFELEAAEVFEDQGELTGNEGKIEAAASSNCPDDRSNLLAMIGRKSLIEALQRTEESLEK